MYRLNTMTGPNSQTLVSGVSYGPANQMLQLNAAAFTETRSYNANLQMTELVSGANVHFKYNYSATQNNGRILSQTDVISGETITYSYDSLNRLIQANGTGDPTGNWSQQFSYDGFGNLIQKIGAAAPSNTALSTDPTTNRLNANGAQYDNNGNLTALGTGSFAAAYTYDIENRMTVAVPAPGGNQVLYGYDSSNQRIYQGTYNASTQTYSNEQLYFYGIDGKKLAVYSVQSSGTVTLSCTTTNIWFAGRLLTPEDRLQSRGKYFPYGEDRYNPTPANPSNDQEKFATYTRDSATLLDYAYQRYYNSQLGRFHTVDPDSGSARLYAPQSWNRYGYAVQDPTNYTDSSGLAVTCFIKSNGAFTCVDNVPPVGGDPGGGGGITPTGQQPPQKPTPTEPGPTDPGPPPCGMKYYNFFNLMVPFANQLAQKWNTDPNFILALSAYESGWDPIYAGSSHKAPINNPYGLTQAGGNDLTFKSLQDATNYWSNNDGQYIKGDQNIAKFAKDLQPHYNTANPAWQNTLVSVYNAELRLRKQCGQ
ncbi:MAG: glucosaminidase domain-containing protein [Acidobacteriaceae bacterium]|nr:glucosaminidase domain-containing protein [Acidobacteriaceae bacterium]